MGDERSQEIAQHEELRQPAQSASVRKVGFRLPGISGVWGMSKVGNTGDKCVHSATFDEAEAICAAIPNGRLCTEKEVKNECASWTGCGHDADLIWVTYMHGVDTRE